MKFQGTAEDILPIMKVENTKKPQYLRLFCLFIIIFHKEKTP